VSQKTDMVEKHKGKKIVREKDSRLKTKMKMTAAAPKIAIFENAKK
jgi:hypothetical protein